MDLKQMQYFLCLAQEGNVTRAARQLNIVQPALSMQIAKLEKSLGKQLFYRSAQGMALTPAGETLTRLIGPIVQDVDRAKDQMAQLDGKVSGRVSIGMITSAAQSTLTASSARIAAQHPDIQLSVCEGYTETLMEWVLGGQLDIAVINVPGRRVALTTHHILDEEMMLAHAARRRLSLPQPMLFDRLKMLDVVIPSRRHGLRRILDDAAAQAGFSLRPRLEIDTLTSVCELVGSTDLVTVLPGIALHAMLSVGRIKAHRMRKPAIARSVVWVTNPRRVISAAMAAVMEIIAADLKAAAASAAQFVRC